MPPCRTGVVESVERQGLVVTKTLGDGLWSRLYAAVRDGDQRQAVTEAFIRSTRDHACDHLPFVRSAERPIFDCTHSEARITAAPVIKLGQWGC
ncbi:trans-activator of metE and metH [Salmonella enterica subsp. enterica]|uniref:Trans-activator of metE and metH n=1 Tax=Salmonella enterica I TaxID=59201 RepID=A0A447TRC5_SALET|nr:trans-activator of metE and metH [Salmonella enterica subsp. enterica]